MLKRFQRRALMHLWSWAGASNAIPAAMVRRFEDTCKDTGVQVTDAGAEVPDIGPEPEAEDRAAVDLEKATSPSVTSATKFASSECMVRLQNDYHQLQREVQTLHTKVEILHSRLDAAHLIEPEAHSELEQRLEAVEKRIPPECSLFSSEAGVGSCAMTPTPTKQLLTPTPTKQPRSASKQPVDFCVKASRWKDCRGRFCRPPSPAR